MYIIIFEYFIYTASQKQTWASLPNNYPGKPAYESRNRKPAIKSIYHLPCTLPCYQIFLVRRCHAVEVKRLKKTMRKAEASPTVIGCSASCSLSITGKRKQQGEAGQLLTGPKPAASKKHGGMRGAPEFLPAPCRTWRQSKPGEALCGLSLVNGCLRAVCVLSA